MTREEFESLLLAQGADLARWPAAERAAAEALLARDPAARDLLEEAARLDALIFGAVQSPAGGGALATRILARLDDDAPRERVFGLGKLAAWAGSAAAAALVAGYFYGQSAGGADATRGLLAFVVGEYAESGALP
jgi:anti-sigma factor RsiW